MRFLIVFFVIVDFFTQLRIITNEKVLLFAKKA